MIDTGLIRERFGWAADHMVAVADALSAADRVLGDGDLGVTFVRGCEVLVPTLDDLPDDVGQALMKCGASFTKSGGSSFGTLLSTGLMAAGRECKGSNAVKWSDLARLLSVAAEAMLQRGKSELGKKTVIDAIDAVAAAVDGETDPGTIRSKALAACDEVLDRFRNQRSGVGRARVSGDRSIGVDDPGMLAWREMVIGVTAAPTGGAPG